MNTILDTPRGEFINAILRETGPITSNELLTHPRYGELYDNWTAALTNAHKDGFIRAFQVETEEGPNGKYYFSRP